MARASHTGDYACAGSYPTKVNVVELVCSYSGDIAWYDSLAIRIATFLGWTAFEDHEDRQVWPLAEETDAARKRRMFLAGWVGSRLAARPARPGLMRRAWGPADKTPRPSRTQGVPPEIEHLP